MLHSGYPAAQRLFRLTNARGLPHPVLDESFESREQALEVALQWLLQQGLLDPQSDAREQEKQLALQVGLEMSTPSGDWRTLRHAGFTGWRSLSA
ncbi:MAG: hypothetical protein ACKOGI_03565 [Vulcanococcus sp.]